MAALALLALLALPALADPAPPAPAAPLRVSEPAAPVTVAALADGVPAEASWQADLDQDGELEEVHLSWTSEVEVLLRVTEPGVTGPGATQVVNLGQAFDINGPQDTVSVRTTAAGETAIPLVHVRWHAREMCGSGDHHRYASYRSPAAGQPGTLAEALYHRGSGGDAPVWWETEVSWTPAEGAVEVRSRAGEHGDDGEMSVHDDRTRRYRLEGVVFVEVAEGG